MKHAKRKGGALCAVLTVLLCAIVFIGCAGNGDIVLKIAELDPVIEAQIKQDWEEQFGFPFHFDYYLGTYNGAVVIFRVGDDASIRIQVIAGVTFTHSLLSEIFVWKENVFFTLEEAYESILTQENIVTVGNTFNRIRQNKEGS
ncbi:MAG: hypothetical protein FWC97_03045 [Treponema sp.]|nr:hypothetical protein [Treponema sp.]